MHVNFQDYNQQQNWLSPSIEELIPQNYPVRIGNEVVEQFNLDPLIAAYSKEGKPSYHPKMMLKVLVYASIGNIYSSHKIKKPCARTSTLCGWPCSFSQKSISYKH